MMKSTSSKNLNIGVSQLSQVSSITCTNKTWKDTVKSSQILQLSVSRVDLLHNLLRYHHLINKLSHTKRLNTLKEDKRLLTMIHHQTITKSTNRTTKQLNKEVRDSLPIGLHQTSKMKPKKFTLRILTELL